MEPINFTLRDLSHAIGRDLMKPNMVKSYGYMFWDLLLLTFVHLPFSGLTIKITMYY